MDTSHIVGILNIPQKIREETVKMMCSLLAGGGKATSGIEARFESFEYIFYNEFIFTLNFIKHCSGT